MSLIWPHKVYVCVSVIVCVLQILCVQQKSILCAMPYFIWTEPIGDQNEWADAYSLFSIGQFFFDSLFIGKILPSDWIKVG